MRDVAVGRDRVLEQVPREREPALDERFVVQRETGVEQPARGERVPADEHLGVGVGLRPVCCVAPAACRESRRPPRRHSRDHSGRVMIVRPSQLPSRVTPSSFSASGEFGRREHLGEFLVGPDVGGAFLACGVRRER